MKRDWTNPWTNPVGEMLYPVLAWATKFMPKVYDSPKPVAADLPQLCEFVLRRCAGECNTYTKHEKLWWPLEQETTIECVRCGGVWVVE